MKAWRRPFLGAVAAVAIAATGACTPVRNPATGDTQYTSMSPAQEAAIGKDEHPKVLAEFGGAYADPALQAYVERVGRSLGQVSELKDQSFTFTVLDSDVVNAFALPGGYVYVSRGLLALADNEAELAGVLGHEIGHITARHTAQRYDRAMLGQLGSLGAAILGGVLLGDTGAKMGQQVGSLGATAYVQGFSRSQELEADQLGIRYMVRAGYDPEAMVSFLDAMDGYGALNRQLSGRSEETPTWLASHPRARDRVRDAAQTAEAQAGQGRVESAAYMRAVDGMIFGDSPEQGHVRGTVFVHPKLDFRFEAPAGFKLVNTPAAVLGKGPRGQILRFDAASAKSADPAAYLTQEWAAKLQPQNLRRFEANGRPAATATAPVAINGKKTQALLAAVSMGEGRMYRFVFASPQLGADSAAFEGVVRSLRRLTAAERAEAIPLRIRIHTVQPGDTIDSLARRMQVDEAAREWFVLLNGLQDGQLVPGQKVKLVVRG
ncbi:M48 family metalloprotease [Geminicoccaceae bacterium 1502E]|nr:M48 family metalloprotease [Geminicoccaceae bacterium 1502E]